MSKLPNKELIKVIDDYELSFDGDTKESFDYDNSENELDYISDNIIKENEHMAQFGSAPD